MKIADVLSFMGIQMSLSWSRDSPYPCEYSENVDISTIPIRYNEGFTCPTNEEFHDAAIALGKQISIAELRINKENEYPDFNTRLRAIEKQLAALCQKSLISFEPDFMKTLSDIEKVDTFYDSQI